LTLFDVVSGPGVRSSGSPVSEVAMFVNREADEVDIKEIPVADAALGDDADLGSRRDICQIFGLNIHYRYSLFKMSLANEDGRIMS